MRYRQGFLRATTVTCGWYRPCRVNLYPVRTSVTTASQLHVPRRLPSNGTDRLCSHPVPKRSLPHATGANVEDTACAPAISMPSAAQEACASPSSPIHAAWTAETVEQFLQAPKPSSSDTHNLRSLLDFLIACDHPRKPVWCAPACESAFRAGFHRRCSELYISCCEAELNRAHPKLPLWPGRTISDILPEIVLQAIVAGRDAQALVRLWAIALHAFKRNVHPSSAENLSAWKASPEVMLAVQVYWVCAALCMSLDKDGRATAHTQLASEDKKSDGTREAAVTSPLESSYSAHGDASDQQKLIRSLAQEASHVMRIPDNDFTVFFATSIRLAMYNAHHSGAGQAAVLQQCLRYWCRQHEERGDGMKWLTPMCLHALLRQAVEAQRWDLADWATLYADLYFHHKSRSALTEVRASDEGRTSAPVGALPLAGTSSDLSLTAHDDSLVNLILRYLHVSHQGDRSLSWLRWLRRCCFPHYLPSISVGNAIARAAVHQHDTHLAWWALEVLLSDRQPSPPSSSELFTCLCALARCGVPHFHEVLQSCESHQLVQLTEEERLYLLLMKCRRSVTWRQDLESLLAAHVALPLSAAPPATAPLTNAASRTLSSRTLYMFLLIMQEGEYPSFMLYYRRFLAQSAALLSLEDRAHWAICSLVWCATQVGRLADDDYTYTIREARQLLQAHPANTNGSTVHDLLPATRRRLQTKLDTLRLQYPLERWQSVLHHPNLSRRVGRRRGRDTRSSPDAMNSLAVGPARDTNRGGDSHSPTDPVVPTTQLFSRFLKRRGEALQIATTPLDLLASVTNDMVVQARSVGDLLDLQGRLEWERALGGMWTPR